MQPTNRYGVHGQGLGLGQTAKFQPSASLAAARHSLLGLLEHAQLEPAASRPRIWVSVILTTVLYCCGSSSWSEPATSRDSRKVYAPSSGGWQQAVGRLRVPSSTWRAGKRTYFNEDCSATLIADGNPHSAATILTAWHCLEFYQDLSRPIIFSVASPSGEQREVEARKLTDGGGMHADWALLRLVQPLAREDVAALQMLSEPTDVSRRISMAGYSRDRGLGERGAHLTYDPGCNITGRTESRLATDCAAYKGASGGAVVQLSEEGNVRLCGVISSGDSAGYAEFVPTEVFRSALFLHSQ